MNEEEKKAIENHFENALNDIVSGIKDSTATEIVMRQQSMILFYKRVMLEIEKRDDLISKLQKENEKLKKQSELSANAFKENTILKDKIIDLMAEDRAEISEPKTSKEAIIDFYFKQVEDKNETD